MLPARLLTCLSAAVLCLGTVACGSDAEENGNGGPTAPVTGALDITTTTTGSTLDPDGYTVTVDGSQDQLIGVNASATFTGLVTGDHAVELTGMASNCTMGSPNPQTVPVAAGGTASTTFTVSCAPALRDKIAFLTNRDGNFEIYVMNVDGSNPVRLTNHPAHDFDPAWSP
jgi:hypothetical protein